LDARIRREARLGNLIDAKVQNLQHL